MIDMVRKTTPSKSAAKKADRGSTRAQGGCSRLFASAKAATRKGQPAKSPGQTVAKAVVGQGRPGQEGAGQEGGGGCKATDVRPSPRPPAAAARAPPPPRLRAGGQAAAAQGGRSRLRSFPARGRRPAGRAQDAGRHGQAPGPSDHRRGRQAAAPQSTRRPLPARQQAAAQPPANKKPVSQRHGFKTNEWIVYPAHGVGRIVGIEEQEIAGMSLELFVITFEKDKMTLRVPTGKSQSVGMRKLAEEDIVKRAMETLRAGRASSARCGAAAPRSTRRRSTPAT